MASKGRGGKRRGFRSGPPGFGSRNFTSELQAILQQTLSNDHSKGIELQDPEEPTEDEQLTNNALCAYKATLKDSAFFISTPEPPVEIQRYSDQFKKKKMQHSLRDVKTDLSFFPYELHCVKDESIIATFSMTGNPRTVQFDLDEAFGNLMAQEDKEQTNKVDTGTENEIDKYLEMDQFLQEEDEYADATDYVENYFDNGEGDELDEDGGGGGEAYFD
ncbi:hypothetical protein Glove_340g80 [Diversispora epigaea]|uniref:DNA-directed RNA polymerase III subunit n=1 Tax=Diversispora epigaea TaxID=1348612 RepID=A0A397HH29_9GLOM|nr:hypothetical protein Glove_340g80 [Diversispora epigaea]